MTTQQTATSNTATEEKSDRADRAVLRQIIAGGGSLIVLEAIKQVIAERAMAGELSKIASLTRLKDELFGKTEKPKKPATNGTPANGAATAAPATSSTIAKKGRKLEQLALPEADDEEVEEEEIDEPADDDDEDEPAEASDDDGTEIEEDDEEETPPPRPARIGKMKKGEKGKRGV